MCLGIPGKVIEKYESGGLTMGKVDFGGVVKEVCLAYVPEAEIGDYVIIHVGFALTRLDEAEAMETLKLLNELEMLQDELPELSERLNEE
ncbi:MAG: HypC/HybG/HupF family hydrogenase formation chaperone [Anaerolineae bacterium]